MGTGNDISSSFLFKFKGVDGNKTKVQGGSDQSKGYVIDQSKVEADTKLKAFFSKTNIDANGDGIVTKQELNMFLSTVDQQAGKNNKLSNHETRQLMRQMGLNKDMSANEFKQILNELQIGTEGVESATDFQSPDGTTGVKVQYAPTDNGTVQTDTYVHNQDGKAELDSHEYKKGPQDITYTDSKDRVTKEIKGYNTTETTYANDTDNTIAQTVTTNSRDGSTVTTNYENGHISTIKTETDGQTVTENYDEHEDMTTRHTEQKARDKSGKEGTITIDENFKPEPPLASTKETQFPDGAREEVETYESGRTITQFETSDGETTMSITEGDKSVNVRVSEDGSAMLAPAENGLTFDKQAEKLGFKKGTPEYEEFKAANQKAAKNGWFQVGQDMQIPAKLRDKVNIGAFSVDSKAEVQKYNNDPRVKAMNAKKEAAKAEANGAPKVPDRLAVDDNPPSAGYMLPEKPNPLDKGVPGSVVHDNETGEILKEYDDKGRVTYEKTGDSPDGPVYRNYEYDASGNLTKTTTRRGDDILRCQTFNSDGSLKEETEFPNGELGEVSAIHRDGKTGQVTCYYEFSEDGLVKRNAKGEATEIQNSYFPGVGQSARFMITEFTSDGGKTVYDNITNDKKVLFPGDKATYYDSQGNMKYYDVMEDGNLVRYNPDGSRYE